MICKMTGGLTLGCDSAASHVSKTARRGAPGCMQCVLLTVTDFSSQTPCARHHRLLADHSRKWRSTWSRPMCAGLPGDGPRSLRSRGYVLFDTVIHFTKMWEGA